MKPFSPEDIRRAVKGRWRWPAGTVTVTGASTDTRTARAGDVFFALRGPSFDGHQFLDQAASAGCLTAVVEQDSALPGDVLGRFAGGVLGVSSPLAALGELAACHRRQVSADVVAVTGSNGKTTVKCMIHHILSRHLKGTASPKSFNNNIGLPLTLLGVWPPDDYVICELGSNAPGEIASLAAIAAPDVAVITSVGPTHLDKLIDVEHVAAEKASLLGALADDGLGVVWSDSRELAKALRAYPARLIRFGQDQSADLRLTGYEPAPGGGAFQFNGRFEGRLRVPGRHMAVNALAAIAVAGRFGIPQAEAVESLGDYRGQEMRLQTVRAGAVTIIDDAFNANPASMLAAGEALASFAGARRVIVAGDMLELGPSTEDLHRATGASLAQCPVALIVGVGKLGRLIAQGAGRSGQVETAQFDSVESACQRLPGLLREGDVVLLKGSRGMAMERLTVPIRAAFDGSTGVSPVGLDDGSTGVSPVGLDDGSTGVSPVGLDDGSTGVSPVGLDDTGRRPVLPC